MKPFAALAGRIACIALLASLDAPQEAHAWGARGHALVGDIAARYLTPAAARQVDELLQGDLLADGRPSGRKTLAQVASWADELRLTPEQKATGVYHYDNVPFCGAPDDAVYCADGKCASAWFARQVAILKDRSQPRRARNEALKWTVHIVGDVHQPLHASDHGDRGGNDVPVTWFGKRGDEPVEGRTPSPYSLHVAWDRLIPHRMLGERGGHAAFLAELPGDETRRNWEVGTLRQWVAEGTDLAREFVYPALPPAAASALRIDAADDVGPFACAHVLTKIRALDDAYYRPAAVIASEQLKKAGVRLAKVLNDALD